MMRPVLSSFADASRCPASDATCRRVHDIEPSLPIHPPFEPHSSSAPCLAHSQGLSCLPAVHVLTGFHMLAEDGIRPWFEKHAHVEVRGSPGCFNLWRHGADGGTKWVQAWGPPAPVAGSNTSMLRVTLDCAAKLLTWHPEYAGRYWYAAADAYEQCKAAATATLVQCDPLHAHNQTIGNEGCGREATPPFILRALYGHHVRVVLALRNPIDRLETAFWFHKQFWSVKTPTAAGLHAYATEQVAGFRSCQAAHGKRRCAFLFERLGAAQQAVFWHCNQLIRGLYAPFVAEWKAAFESRSLVIRVEDLLDSPQATGTRLQVFLGLVSKTAWVPAVAGRAYTAAHAASLNVSCCGGGRGEPQPMLPATRQLLDEFYRPFNVELSAILQDPLFDRSWS